MLRIADIKYNSPAHISGKIEDGDEIIQINYQTVVGWHYKRVLQQLQESPPDVLLTLKKRPRHTKIYGQIYMKPYRLPSKKRSLPYRFGENLPSPRIEFVASGQNFPVLLPLTEKGVADVDGGNLSDSDSSSTTTESSIKSTEKDKSKRLYLPKPRAVLQRRNTICGDQASGFRGNITFWHEMNIRRTNLDGNSLRDKSVSVGYGLDATKRPITCVGIHSNKEKYGDLSGALKGSLPDMMKPSTNANANASVPLPQSPASPALTPTSQLKKQQQQLPHNNSSDNVSEHNVGRSKVVKFDPAHDIIEHTNVDANAGELNQETATDTMPLPSLPMKQMGGITPNSGTGLAEAINVTLIQNKSRHIVRDEGLLRHI